MLFRTKVVTITASCSVSQAKMVTCAIRPLMMDAAMPLASLFREWESVLIPLKPENVAGPIAEMF